MKDSLPGNDILYDDLIVSFKKGMRKNKIDISEFKIKFQKDGLLVGFEWLIIDKNKYNFEYTENKIKKSFISYDPAVVINYTKERLGYSYFGGKWNRNKKQKKTIVDDLKNNAMTPAINVVLSN